MRQPGKRPKPKAAKKIVRPPAKKAPFPIFAPKGVKAPALLAQLDELRVVAKASTTMQSKREWTGWLRRIAALLFVGDDLERSVTAWHREQFADLVALETVQRWATTDGWVRQREERVAKFREAVERQIGSDNVRAFIADLRRLDDQYADIGDKIAGLGNVVQRSYTNAAGKRMEREIEVVPTAFDKRAEAYSAFLNLDRRRDEKRKGVLGGLPSALGAGPARDAAVTTTIVLSPAVARAMARAKLLAERAEIEAEESEDADDESESETE